MTRNSSLALLSEALPIRGRALSLKTSFNQSLITSFNYLLEVCQEVIPSNVLTLAREKLSSLNPESKLSGLLGLLHAEFFKAAEQNDPMLVNYIVERLSKENLDHEDVTYVSLSNLDEYYSPFISHIFSQEIKREVEFFSLSAEEFEKAKTSIQRGVKILERSFPDFFAEFQELVSEILVLKAKGLYQGSSSELFGMIYKSSMFRGERTADAVDFLVHEHSHLYLHSLNKDDPILLNPSERHYSPLREDDRPLMGVYHATFVLSRMQYVLDQALILNEIPEDEKEYCKELLTFYRKCFHEGFDTIMTHGQMTPLGSALILSASKLLP